MKKIVTLIALVFTFPIFAQEKLSASRETVVFFRHGEKPVVDVGQLNCKGLNRALRLEKVLVPRFGKPDYLFAPKPFEKVTKQNERFLHFRPFMTMEPLAIALNMPVNIQYGVSQTEPIAQELLLEKYKNSTVYVSWEHKKLVKIVRHILKKTGSDPQKMAEWPSSEFDRLAILKITRGENGKISSEYSVGAEGIEDKSLSDSCSP